MRPLIARLENGYCSITVVNHQLITVIRFAAKNYTHPWKSFANRLRLVLHECKISFLTYVFRRNQTRSNTSGLLVIIEWDWDTSSYHQSGPEWNEMLRTECPGTEQVIMKSCRNEEATSKQITCQASDTERKHHLFSFVFSSPLE